MRTHREKEVLGLVAAGAMDKEIAADLITSPHTVKAHLRDILAKLQASSRHVAVAYGVQDGLTRPPS